MSTREARGAVINTSDEETIGTYLRDTPDFFVRNEPLLAHLRLPHARGSAAVSLVERQVEVLREKNQSLEGKLGEFVSVARDNEQLGDKVHQFTRRLMGASSRRAVVAQLEKSLREDFEVFHANLVLIGAAAAGLELGRFVTPVERGDPSLAGFESLLSSGKPRCGQVRDSQRDFLFGTESAGVASLALVPLGGEVPFGLLALGSPDRDRFHPGMSVDFLRRIGELLADALSRG